MFYRIVDIEAEREKQGDSHETLSLLKHKHRQVGYYVKLIFDFYDPSDDEFGGSESMWVEITEVFPEVYSDYTRYRGKLANHPFSTDELHPGANIYFGQRHILEWQPSDAEWASIEEKRTP